MCSKAKHFMGLWNYLSWSVMKVDASLKGCHPEEKKTKTIICFSTKHSWKRHHKVKITLTIKKSSQQFCVSLSYNPIHNSANVHLLLDLCPLYGSPVALKHLCSVSVRFFQKRIIQSKKTDKS